MNLFPSFALIALLLSSCLLYAQPKKKNLSDRASLKPRLVVLTDISTWEPDDHESLIRLLVHADLFEIEGIVITSGWSMDDVNKVRHFKDIALGVIDAYEKDLPNLMKRSGQHGFEQGNSYQEIGYWPRAQYLRDRTMFGSLLMGMDKIGVDNTSEGSELIIKLADEADERPLWVTLWGGGNTLAQAIWEVQQSRGEAELMQFLNKLRVYAITDQDRPQRSGFDSSSHAWMRREFADDLLFIWDECAWKFQNGTGKNKWQEYATHIQNHGNLGSQYPKYKWGVEGDTPAFLHVMPIGLNNPDDPKQAGWGGYAIRGKGEDSNGISWVNFEGSAYNTCRRYEEHFYPATFNNFAARMDWAKEGRGNRNPVVVVEGNATVEILTKRVRPGAVVVIDASASLDPDGDALDYKWWIQPEAGTWKGEVNLSVSEEGKASLTVPAGSEGKSIHIICEVTDNGTPKLTSYRRIILEADSFQRWR